MEAVVGLERSLDIDSWKENKLLLEVLLLQTIPKSIREKPIQT
jgi:hypothetical protein